MKKAWFVLLLALCLVACGCVRSLRHDPAAAATQAEEFIRLEMVDGDFASAHAMFREEDQQQLSVGDLEQMLADIHPDGRPTSVEAVAYEPVPGEAAVMVFVNGTDGTHDYYYRVHVVGTMDSGYHPYAVYRNAEPYPPTDLKQDL